MSNDELNRVAKQVADLLLSQQMLLTTAESCTGGWVAQAMTAIEGSSSWFERGFVCYSNEAKQELLQVPATLILQHGAVSAQTAQAMAKGALMNSRAQIALATTGIAGPGGGSAIKPVGTVIFAWYGPRICLQSAKMCFRGDRTEVRRQAVEFALSGLAYILRNL